MANVVLYSTEQCPYCVRAKELLKRKQVFFEEIRVDLEPNRRVEMEQRSRRRTVPQIFIGDHHVGGFDDLYALERAGQLDAMLK